VCGAGLGKAREERERRNIKAGHGSKRAGPGTEMDSLRGLSLSHSN